MHTLWWLVSKSLERKDGLKMALERVPVAGWGYRLLALVWRETE
jgi:hypothetical protein